MTTARTLPAYGIYVDGEWKTASTGATYTIPNPATEEPVAEIADATRDDLRAAIIAARRAFDDGPWRRAARMDRRNVLYAIADGLERRKDDARRMLLSAAGVPQAMIGVQLDKPIEMLRWYGDLAVKFDAEQVLPPVELAAPGGVRVCTSLVVHQPVGVCAMIPTWNGPLIIIAQKLGPGIAMGNTMVFKPSPLMPLIDLLVAEVIAECDLPKGVYNLITGQSPDLGQDLVESPMVDKVSFTGSVPTGKRIAETAARTLKRVHLELGGKSAALVLDDADLDQAAPVLAAGVFIGAGQGCSRTTRVLVQEKRQEALLEKMAAFTQKSVKLGDPVDPAVLVGPVIREESRRRIEGYIEAGKHDGATLVLGGGRPKQCPRGYFVEATLFGNVRNDMKIAAEEIFGPVISVIPFRDEEDAIRIANASSYGLAGAILTRDEAKAIAIAKRVRTGNVSINGAYNIFGPIGGFKESGLGREGGIFGLREFSEVQCITW